MSNPNLLPEGAAAMYINMSVAFLRSGRLHGIVGGRTPPPPYLKLGRTVRYDTRSSDDLVWGLGLGCEGAMAVG